MKLLLNIFCWILVAYCVYFPISFFESTADRKEVKISHILVDSEQKANEIRQEILDKKITFEDAAVKHSLCASKDDKGDIGYNMRGMLFKEIEDVALKAERKVISEPVKTEEGWHLVKVTDIKYFSNSDSFAKKY